MLQIIQRRLNKLRNVFFYNLHVPGDGTAGKSVGNW
jgi:hypothetical protein